MSLLYQRLIEEVRNLSLEHQAAYELAWQVFFQLHVMPYEMEKQKLNGDI